MLRDLQIKQKITSMPLIAGITFFLIIVILILLNNYNKSLSNKIQSHYYPLLELNQNYEDHFSELQNSLQDAVATADTLEIEKSEFLFNSLYANIDKSSKGENNNEVNFKQLAEDLDQYYSIAKLVSIRMISEATDEDLVHDLELMTVKYNLVKQSFSNNVNFYKEAISNEFEALNYNQNLSLLIIIIATFLAAILIGWISKIIIKSITDPLKDVVNLANEVGSGNLDAEVSEVTNDEFGLLKEAFREMIIKIKSLLKEKDHTLKDLESEVKVRKKAERELNKHKNNLEELVQERTKELESTNVTLEKQIKVRKKAEEKQKLLIEEIENINQELKNFAYVVSHDLKAPLRAIGSLSDWIRNDYADKLDDEGQELIRLLDTRVKRMHNLIEGILQYSRVGRMMEEKVFVDLNDTVKGAIELISPPDNISIEVDNELPAVVIEKTRIEQIFQNLISNAIKYMDKPKGNINIGSSSKNGIMNFYVTDNGPGIEKKYFDKIFQIFQTLNARDNFESTGVGLSLVKKIVEMYGGKIWVESKLNEGSTFYFSLPKKLILETKESN